MNIILLSGGSGKRLWPLSNDIRSKQFIKIFKAGDGYESMLQRVYRQIKEVDTDTTVTIATSKKQVSSINSQIGGEVGISVEPCRRDTFPAIALAAAYLHETRRIPRDEAVIVCPVDPFVGNDYFAMLRELAGQVDRDEAKIVLMGIEPTYPSEKYGYIIPEHKGMVSKVASFHEKPDLKTAKRYFGQGALWNGGIFAFRMGYILDLSKEILGTCSHKGLLTGYESLPAISFDYAVVEKESSLQVMRFPGQWKDIGTWNTLTEVMDEPVVGDAQTDDECKNVHVINELSVPVIAMGLHDVVISASPEGILVSDKERSSFIKPFVDKLSQQVMFAEKSWGSFRVLDVEKGSIAIKVTLNAGHGMNYHNHKMRDEVWVVVSGSGTAVVDGDRQKVCVGDVIKMRAGCCHTILAETELKVIEVQIGKEISVYDKCKFELDSQKR